MHEPGHASLVSLASPTPYLVAMKFTALLAASLAALAIPGSAFAGSCAPPGNSGVDQYFETVPGAGCNQPPGGHHHHGKGLSPSTNRHLASQGGAGRAVQNLVNSSGTAGISSGGGALPSTGGNPGAGGNGRTGGSGHGASGGKNGAAGANPSAPTASGRSLVSAILHPILSGSNSGGLGIVLPLLLGGLLVLAVVGLLRRRRSRAAAPQAP